MGIAKEKKRATNCPVEKKGFDISQRNPVAVPDSVALLRELNAT